MDFIKKSLPSPVLEAFADPVLRDLKLVGSSTVPA